jgi:uncharacterized membrane protein
MTAYAASYLATALVLLVLDLSFITFVAMPVYVQGIGHLMASEPYLPAAAVFYGVFTLGLMVFAVLPHRAAASWRKTAVAAALYGFFTYATYDLTNLATLRDWPVRVVLMDLVWGCVVSTAASLAGRAALKRLQHVS